MYDKIQFLVFWKNFLENNLVKQISDLHQQGFTIPAFMMLAQSIELLGALLDDKPLRAKEQSKKRFGLALKALFPSIYVKANDKDWLYVKYRCHMVHSLLPSSHLRLLAHTESGLKNLQYDADAEQIVLILENWQEDFCNAVQKLLVKMEEGHVKIKKVDNTVVS